MRRKRLFSLLMVFVLSAAFMSQAAYALPARPEPAGFIDEVHIEVDMPLPGQALTGSLSRVPEHSSTGIVWSQSGTVAVDRSYDYRIHTTPNTGAPSNSYYYAENGSIDISFGFPDGHSVTVLQQSFASNATIANLNELNYVTQTNTWTSSTVNFYGTITPYHSINYDTAGGTLSGTYPSYIAHGDSISMSELPVPGREGYEFKGWDVDSTDLDELINGTAMYLSDVCGPRYLVAVWEREAREYTMSFDSNGGSGSMDRQLFREGVRSQIRANAFTREGYDFTGWNTAADGSGADYSDGQRISISGDTMLYAQWRLRNNYVVLIPDGDSIVIDPVSRSGQAAIGIQAGSVIAKDSGLQMWVNAGRNYDDYSQRYQMQSEDGGYYTGYELRYRGESVNPGSAENSVLLETAEADRVSSGFQEVIGVSAYAAPAAGTYRDTLTFSFKVV